MLLSPSWSPSPEKSPVTTSSPPLLPATPPSSPPTPVVVLPPTSSVPPVISPPPPIAAPLTSPPSPPTPVVVLPPTSSVPPVISPPPPPVNSTLPVTAPLPPPEAPTPPVVGPPPLATTIPPVISPPSPEPLTPPVTSPPLPTTPLAPANSPPPPPTTPLAPANSPPPPPLSPSPLPTVSPPPLAPTASPPSRATPLAPLNPPPPPPPTSSTILPSPTRPDKPPASALVSAPPPLPSSIMPPQIPKSLAYPPPSSRQSHLPTGLIVTGVTGVVLLLLVLGILCICCKNRKKRRDSPLENYYKPPLLGPKDNSSSILPQLSQQSVPPPGAHAITVLTLTNSSEHSSSINIHSENPIPTQSPGVALGFSIGNFKYDELLVATNGFSDANLLGQGGFGYVHKGVLPNGKQVAVKQLKEKSQQGEREFQAEVETISRVHHKHLVSLVGYCSTGAERLLVYEYVPNDTLEYHLHGKGQPVMAWATRLKIALGCAKGLAYLHEDCNPTIIHRDIKAANILLDYKFEAKVSDFGLAKIFSDTNFSITHISTRVVGTFGYLAPEYATSGKVTDKADVYSYGVMLLQLITGRPPISAAESLMKEGIVDWARPLLTQALKDGNFNALVDPRLESNYNISEVASMVVCAAACVRHSAWLRPRMSQIVRALEGDVPLKGFSEGIRPGDSSVYNAQQYKEDIKIFNLMLRSQQYGSGTTSDYGLNPSSSSSDDTRQTEI